MSDCRVGRLVIVAAARPLALRAGRRPVLGVVVGVGVTAMRVRVAGTVAVALMAGVARHARSMGLGERADAVTNPMLAVGKAVLALLHALRNLLAPHRRIEAPGRAGARDGDRGRRHG